MLELPDKPVVFYNRDGCWKPLFDLVQHTVDSRLTPLEVMRAWIAVKRIEDVVPVLRRAELGSHADGQEGGARRPRPLRSSVPRPRRCPPGGC